MRCDYTPGDGYGLLVNGGRPSMRWCCFPGGNWRCWQASCELAGWLVSGWLVACWLLLDGRRHADDRWLIVH